MTRLKLSLRNSVKSALLFNSFLLLLNISGCGKEIAPTYNEKDIPYLVKEICKEEYNLDVTTQRTSNTLWIYAPLNKMLDKEFGIKEDKIFDEEISDNLRNILTTIGRVLISSDYTPEFYILVASDIKIGIDYTIISYVEDVRKSYAGVIPWTEANRRYVIGLERKPEAIDDTTGSHVHAHNIKLEDFLAEQMAQRISVQFQEESQKNLFRVEKSEGKFLDGTFIFEYSIEKISEINNKINIREEILDTVAYCIKSYEFKDFSGVELVDLKKQDRLILNQAAIWERPIG